MSTQALIRYDTMCKAIDQAYRVDEVKDIRDKALALEAYARQAKNTEAERRACEIRLRAERKAGSLLKTMAKAKQRQTGGKPKRSRGETVSTLLDLGVTKGQSSRWQQLAAVPEGKFEAALASHDKPTTRGIIASNHRAPSQPAVSREALWLWGRLRDLERDYLDRAPAEVLATLTSEMLDDVRRITPLAASWLSRLQKEAAHGEAQAA